jgi:Flp pilus assembly CpaE family ATPase
MKVVVAHGPGNNVRELRKLLHGAGAHCATEDCVVWEDLATRLGQAEFDLVVVHAAPAVDWATINQAKAFTSAPLVAIGPNGDVEAAARQAGVSQYLVEERLHSGLGEVLHQMLGEGEIRCQRGRVLAVLAPTGGNGGTFVALNLAAQFAGAVNGPAAFLDMSAGCSKVPLMLAHEPETTLEDTCGRLHRIDRASLLGLYHRDPCGLNLLYGSAEHPSEGYLNSEAVRKLGVLSRMSAAATVLNVGQMLRQPQFDALRLADKVVLVVRPDVPSLNRAAMTIEQITHLGIQPERMVVAVNFWGEYGLVSKQHIEEILHWKNAVYLTYDPGRVNRCINEGVLLRNKFPRCRLAKELTRLAALLMA